MGQGLSTLVDSRAAAEQACDQALAKLDGAAVDLAFVFFTPQHVDHAQEISKALHERCAPGALLGTSAVSVIGGGREIERGPGVSVLLASLPGVRVQTFDVEDFPPIDDADRVQDWANALHAGPDLRLVVMFVDPFSIPLGRVLPLANKALQSRAPRAEPGGLRVSRPVLFGGLASASAKAGGNVLLHQSAVMRSGAVGVSLSGRLRIDTVISQGCRPIGPTMVVTRAKANLIFELGGKPAVRAIQEIVEALGENPQEVLKGGLFIGAVIDEYKERFGRNDFLIRNIVGVDQEGGSIAVADPVRVGQTVRLHTRDAKTASEDLALLLDAQKLYDAPFGSLMVTCNARGERLFSTRHHDAQAVVRAFRGQEPATTAGGNILDPGATSALPQAGFFALGEIGPIGGTSFLHGNTASVVLFREM